MNCFYKLCELAFLGTQICFLGLFFVIVIPILIPLAILGKISQLFGYHKYEILEK